MLSAISIPNVVFFTTDPAQAHALRQSIRRAGLTAHLETFDSSAELLHRLCSGDADFLLMTQGAFAQVDPFTVREFVEQVHDAAHAASVLLVETEEGSAESSLPSSHRSFLAGVQRTTFDRLPESLERAFRARRDQKVRARVEGELNRTAEILRDNQKLIALGRLTASIVHEINNPLESVTNLLYLLENEQSAERRHEFLELAQRELNRVVQISRQTLTFSRESANPVQVQAVDLMEEVMTLYSRRIADKRLLVVREFEATESVNVFPGEMRQVLSNLVANAIEATAPGGMLRLRIRPARNWGDQGVRGLRISIADTGAGMPPEVRNRIGEPFFTTKGSQGTGLGLWVTRSILHRYNGQLQLRSATGREQHGTVFSLFLPTNMRPQAVTPTRIGGSMATAKVPGASGPMQANTSQPATRASSR